jgi:ornithine--oxo-acid transaminase
MTSMEKNLTTDAVAEAERWTAHNYHPLPVVIADADGAWVTDVDGKRYLDCLAGYSALNFGHRHPALIDAARKQLEHVTLTSRAFIHDQFGPFCRSLAELCDMTAPPDTTLVLPMNTGAEAVETAIKVARKWGYKVKGVPDGQATIVVAADNFHGRTTTIISFSTDPDARADYGPYTPGFRIVPYGDLDAMRAAIDETTVAVLIEPIQGEAGVLVPPPGYLSGVRQLCTDTNVLFCADEIQSGLGRTGDTFACDHEQVVPDMYILGKALGGGVVPVSAVVARADILGVLRPGEHGSTFGGNPLACAVGIAVVDLLRTGEFQDRAREVGAVLHGRLNQLVGSGVTAVRGRGLWAGVDIDPSLMTGRQACERLMARGVLAKDTHGSTIRLAPPLVVTTDEINFAVDQLAAIL